MIGHCILHWQRNVLHSVTLTLVYFQVPLPLHIPSINIKTEYIEEKHYLAYILSE